MPGVHKLRATGGPCDEILCGGPYNFVVVPGFLKKKKVGVPWVTILCSKQEGLRYQTETFYEFKLLLIPSRAQFRFIALLLLLLLRWPCSPVRTFTSPQWTYHSLDLSFKFVILLNFHSCTVHRDHWGDPDVDGRIILKWIFRKWEGVVRTEWSWLRIGRGGGHLWVR